MEHQRGGPVAARRIRALERHDVDDAHALATFAGLDQGGKPRDERGTRERKAPGLLLLSEDEVDVGGFRVRRCSAWRAHGAAGIVVSLAIFRKSRRSESGA